MEPRYEPTQWSISLPWWTGLAGLLLLALLPWPYGYYVFLRWVVCGAALLTAWDILRYRSASIGGWLMIGCAVLYNPLVPVHLKREVWMVVNVVTAALFWWVNSSGRGR